MKLRLSGIFYGMKSTIQVRGLFKYQALSDGIYKVVIGYNRTVDKNSNYRLLPWSKTVSINPSDFDGVPEDTLQFALNEANHDRMFKSALECLRGKDSNATFEEAENLVKMMRASAKKALEARK